MYSPQTQHLGILNLLQHQILCSRRKESGPKAAPYLIIYHLPMALDLYSLYISSAARRIFATEIPSGGKQK